MGIFSKTCEYAIRAVFYIANNTRNGERVMIKEIAVGIASPEHFLAKILQDLSRRGIIQSVKGPHGGFFIDVANYKLPLAEIVSAVDGNGLFTGCAMGLEYCSEISPCPLHHEFKAIRDRMHSMLENTTIGDFHDELDSGANTLNRLII